MKDFKYCIWLCPDSNHPWNFFTNRFIPHLSIKTNLDYHTAIQLYTKINKPTLEIELDKLICQEEDDFHSMFYTLKEPINKPEWFPQNAHISFLYKYNQQISPYEVHHLYSNMKYKKGLLKNLCMTKCSGHYTKWKVLFTKPISN